MYIKIKHDRLNILYDTGHTFPRVFRVRSASKWRHSKHVWFTSGTFTLVSFLDGLKQNYDQLLKWAARWAASQGTGEHVGKSTCETRKPDLARSTLAIASHADWFPVAASQWQPLTSPDVSSRLCGYRSNLNCILNNVHGTISLCRLQLHLHSGVLRHHETITPPPPHGKKKTTIGRESGHYHVINIIIINNSHSNSWWAVLASIFESQMFT